ncbi:hypothetical protein LINGRAHAP2_LOCUS37023 [Linum grandiflorum]
MEDTQSRVHDLKVDVTMDCSSNNGGRKFQPSSASSSSSSCSKNTTASACLCSPTSHVGSFRCRLHRSPSLQRTKSMDGCS